tara:strand:+ start:227 stop:520 length:294 start_codon:yes stop_codon:yes gene_type:complete
MAKNKMRAGYGQVLIKHKGKLIPTSVGSRSYENIFNKKASSLTEGSIPAGYAHRPDLIANLFLNTPGAWWLVCEQNSIFDVFEQLNAGDRIKLPNPL